MKNVKTANPADLAPAKSKTVVNPADSEPADITTCHKEILTSEEVAKYMGISKSYLYKLTMRQQIPHYKPMGKMCYFNRAELMRWLQRNRVSTDSEIDQKAQAYCMKKGGNL
jgi:excisionase family DNA binding protein